MIVDRPSDNELPSRRAKPASLAELGALLGVPIRTSILLHLSDGSRRPAGEIAALAGASPQSASAHLACLVEGGLLSVERQGRHRFFRIASGDVAELVEHLASWIDQPRRQVRHERSLCHARLCYDHLAGRLGVAICDRVMERGYLAFDGGRETLSDAGRQWCERNSVQSAVPPGSRRPLFRLCLDWTERRHHLGGHMGASIGRMMSQSGYVRAAPHGRPVTLTARGVAFLRAELELDWPGPD